MPSTASIALTGLLDILRCPTCGGSLEQSERALACPAHHSFDLARAGYVSLVGGAGAISGDDDEMARARERFLTTGAYAPLLEVIGDLAQAEVPALSAAAPGSEGRLPRPSGVAPTVLDAGCGPGYYLAGLLDRFPATRGAGFDTSSRSLRFAAHAHERAAVYSGDVFAPFPLVDGSVDLLLDVFAPRNPEEFARVLRPGGRLLVARPAGDHLSQLRELIPTMVAVDPRKEERLHTALDPYFETTAQRVVHHDLALDATQARDLIAMTPSARHVDDASLDLALTRQVSSPLTITISVLVSAHRVR